jgi:hypothetical protein
MIASIQVSSLTLNADGYTVINKLDGLDLPPVRLSSFNLAGEHFGRHVAAYYGARRFSLGGVLKGDSVNDFLARRTAFFDAFDAFNGEQTITFTLSDGRVLTLTAVTVNLDFSPHAGWATAAAFHVELEAAFPFFTSANVTSIALSLPTGGGGTVPPSTMPMGLSMGGGSSVATFNPGTSPSYPTIRIAGPVTNPAIRNITTGKELRLALTMVAGEYLDIDARGKTITDQGGTNRYAIRSGDWLTIQPGSNTLAFVADSSDPAALATVAYAATYLAI